MNSLLSQPRRPVSAKLAVAVVFVTANFMSIMDTTIVNVALPTVGRDFGVDASGLSSVNVGYLVALAVFIPVSGWLGNRFGTRRTMLAALALFTLASGLCSTADSLGTLTGYRVLQGIGGGLLAPVGMTMMLRAFPQAERLRAQKYVMLPTAVAPAMGPVLGGWLVDTASWHWVFLVNLPVGVAGLLFGTVCLPDFAGAGSLRFDLSGFMLAGGGLAAVLFGLAEAAEWGWGSPTILSLLTGGVALLAAMVWWELRTRHPMIEVRVIRDRLFRTTQLALLPTGAAFMGTLYLYPLFLQNELGYDAFRSGLSTFPEALGMLTASQFVPHVHDRVGARRLMMAGGTGGALVMTCLAALDGGTPRPFFYLLLYLLGVFVGTLFMSAQNAAFVTVPAALTGDATTVLNMQRQTAGAFGVALAGTLLASIGADGPDTTIGASAYRVGFLVMAALGAVAASASALVGDGAVQGTHRARTGGSGDEGERPGRRTARGGTAG